VPPLTVASFAATMQSTPGCGRCRRSRRRSGHRPSYMGRSPRAGRSRGTARRGRAAARPDRAAAACRAQGACRAPRRRALSVSDALRAGLDQCTDRIRVGPGTRPSAVDLGLQDLIVSPSSCMGFSQAGRDLVRFTSRHSRCFMSRAGAVVASEDGAREVFAA